MTFNPLTVQLHMAMDPTGRFLVRPLIEDQPQGTAVLMAEIKGMERLTVFMGPDQLDELRFIVTEYLESIGWHIGPGPTPLGPTVTLDKVRQCLTDMGYAPSFVDRWMDELFA